MTKNPEPRRAIAFAPAVSLPVMTNERIPKMFVTLSKRFDVVPIPLSRFNRIAYDQKVNKFARYLLFPLDELVIFFNSVRLSKKHKVALLFAENAYTSLAGGLAAKILRIPLVWDNHGNVKLFAEAMQKSSFFTSANIALERLLQGLATQIIVVSRMDKDAYVELGFDIGKFEIIPICADLQTVRKNSVDRASARARLSIPKDQKIVLFFGTLGYYPNLEAVEYIANELYPEAKKKIDNVHFYVAGGGTYPGKLPDGVHHLGFVPFDPDLCIWLSAADVCIAPLWRGVGVLTKVVDMLSAGKPAVLSPLCLKGIPELEHGVNCLVGEDSKSFTREVVRLLDDDDLQKRIARNGMDLIEQRYSWEVVGPRVWEILESIMMRTRRDR
ncbi:MAG: glycosyltransferase family 4 protein [Methanomassiliicoccales archaeon]|nr:glycosyltransferase family 4 protein [Methanomassiliicoccales archaeon]